MQKNIFLLILFLFPLFQTHGMLSRFSKKLSTPNYSLLRTLANKILNDTEKNKIKIAAQTFAEKKACPPHGLTKHFWTSAYCHYINDKIKDGDPLNIILSQWKSDLHSEKLFNYYLNEWNSFFQKTANDQEFYRSDAAIFIKNLIKKSQS
jgi:hypothetical protein